MKVGGHDMFFVDRCPSNQSPDGSNAHSWRNSSGQRRYLANARTRPACGIATEAFQEFLQSVQLAEGTVVAAPMTANIGGNNTNAPVPPLETAKSAPLGYSLPPN